MKRPPVWAAFLSMLLLGLAGASLVSDTPDQFGQFLEMWAEAVNVAGATLDSK